MGEQVKVTVRGARGQTAFSFFDAGVTFDWLSGSNDVLRLEMDGPQRRQCSGPCAALDADPVPTARDRFAVWIAGQKAGVANLSVTVIIVSRTGAHKPIALTDSVLVEVSPVLSLVSPAVTTPGPFRRTYLAAHGTATLFWGVVCWFSFALLYCGAMCWEVCRCAPVWA